MSDLRTQTGASAEAAEPGFAGGARLAARLPTYSVDQVAHYLTTGFWQDDNKWPRAFDLAPREALSVNIASLTAAGKTLARHAMRAWEEVSDLTFRLTTSAWADITFDDAKAGAYAETYISGGTILASQVNVGTGWLDWYGTQIGSYSAQTYIHELGHALGLGHAGYYNGEAGYATNAHYANDSWQMSVMSYFDQTQNPTIRASYGHTLTPMPADIAAIQNLYGTLDAVRPGNTVYGAHSNATGTMAGLHWQIARNTATIVDTGGIDRIDFSTDSVDQAIDLRPGMISSVRGGVGNLIIDRSTLIENVASGAGDDTIAGNGANNVIASGAGNDVLWGGAGTDIAVQDGRADTVMVSLDGNVLLVHGPDGSIDRLNGIETLRLETGDIGVSELVSILATRPDPTRPMSAENTLEAGLMMREEILTSVLTCPFGPRPDALTEAGADMFVFAQGPAGPDLEMAPPPFEDAPLSEAPLAEPHDLWVADEFAFLGGEPGAYDLA